MGRRRRAVNSEAVVDLSNGKPMEQVFDRGNPARRCKAHRKNGERSAFRLPTDTESPCAADSFHAPMRALNPCVLSLLAHRANHVAHVDDLRIMLC
jgi:hypothetical protein